MLEEWRGWREQYLVHSLEVEDLEDGGQVELQGGQSPTVDGGARSENLSPFLQH